MTLPKFSIALPALSRDLEFVRELEAFQGPILSEYHAVDGGTVYLEKWCAVQDSITRWLMVRTEQRAVAEYLGGRLSMLDLLQGPSDNIGFIIDRQGDKVVAVYLV